MSEETKMDNKNDNEMAEKLKAAGEKAEKQKAVRRERQVRGSHLVKTSEGVDGPLVTKPRDAGLEVDEKSGFLKITGATKGRAIYVAKKGGRVDLSGFTVQASAVKQITEEEARDKHLGKVRGQLDFTQADADVLAAFDLALAELGGPKPAASPAPAAEAAPEAPKAE